MSRSSLGFRPPQFSEDTAWLPPWLQPNQPSRLDDSFADAQTLRTQACKVQSNLALEKDVHLSAREDAGFNFRLLLSASDDSHVGMTPSGNLLHFHLHLSSNGTSQYTPSPASNAFQTEQGESNGIPSMQLQPEIPACSKDGSCPYKLAVKSDKPNAEMKSKSKKSPKSKSLTVSKDGKGNRKKHKVKGNCKNLINADVTDAVELSIAASEALAVSDIMSSDFSSETLQASSVLEVALRLKQARNQLCPTNLEDDCVTDMFDETDLLQNMDEDIMEDAYEDVGLSIRPADNTPEDQYYPSPAPEHRCSLSGISRVLDTPLSENLCEHHVEMQNIELKSQEVQSVCISNQNFQEALLTQSTSMNTPSESFCESKQEKLYGDQHLVLDTYSPETHLEPQLNQAVQTNARLSTNQGTNTCIDNESLSRTQENILLSPRIHNSRNAGAMDEAFYVRSDKFTSRWLGGWSGKDANVPAFQDFNVVNRTTKFVTKETSFISESVHTVQDENALIRKPELGQIISSMSSVAYEGLCSATNGMEVSQELMSSYNLSLADPLCSVVPCSISSSDANVNIDANHGNVENEADKCLNPASENGLGDLQFKTAGPCVDSDNGEEHMLVVEDSEVSTRRHFMSLQTYSMLGPPRKVDLDRNASLTDLVPVAGISEFYNFEENIDCFKSSNRKECISYSKPTSKITSGRDNVEDHETLGVGILNSKAANHKEPDNEDRSSPLVLNRRARRRLQATKIVLSNDTKGVNQTSPVPKDLETGDQLCYRDTITVAPCPSHSKRTNASVPRDELCFQATTAIAPLPPLHSKRPNPSEDQGPRKRVRFLEDESTVLEPRSVQVPQSRYHTRSNTRSSKRLKKVNHRPDLRTQEGNSDLKNCRSHHRKRMIFQGLEFLLTGFSYKKERELEMLIRKHGGFIVSDVPPPPCLGRKRGFKCKFKQLPILLSPKKLETSKFLYGCAVNAFLLHMCWLTDSIVVGSLLPPDKYMLLSSQNSIKHNRIGRPVHCADLTYVFHNLGIMLHGKHNFCTNIGNLVKHGGGQVFKTLQWLVQSLKNGKISMGAIVIEDEGSASRHLRHCAEEQKIPVMTANWIVESLLSRRLIPSKGSHLPFSSTSKISEFFAMGYSEEI